MLNVIDSGFGIDVAREVGGRVKGLGMFSSLPLKLMFIEITP